MRFEKITENKIRITLNMDDLKQKNIDLHAFMSNSLETQSLFLDMLKEAEQEVGFITKDYKIMIEALAMSDGYFILTVTRSLPEIEKDKFISKKICTKRKTVNVNNSCAIYCFASFDDFCIFCNSLEATFIKKINSLFTRMSLFSYNSNYYLVLNKVSNNTTLLKKFYFLLSEFSNYVPNSNLFENKLLEYGKLIIKTRAINKCLKHFS